MSLVPVFLITVRNSLRILGKAIIVGGAVFFSYDQGIWSTQTDHNEKHVKLVKKHAEDNFLDHVPFHKLPTADDIKVSWNDGMHRIFTTLDEAPQHVINLTEEVKKFIKTPPKDE